MAKNMVNNALAIDVQISLEPDACSARREENNEKWLDSEEDIRAQKAYTGALCRLAYDDMNSDFVPDADAVLQIYQLANLAANIASQIYSRY